MKKIGIIGFGMILLGIIFGGCKSRTNYMDEKFQTEKNLISSTLKDIPMLENEDIITIQIPELFEHSEGFVLDHLLDSIWYVPLETNNLSLIEYVEEVILFQDFLFILDKFGKRVLKFDSNGKFIKQIGSNGRGPGEYTTPHSFQIINEMVLVHDDRTSKIMYYDLNGNFIKDERLGLRINRCTSYGKDKFICDIAARDNFHRKEISDYKLIFTESDWVITGKADYYDAESKKFANSRATVTKFKDKLIYNPSFDYFIYSVNIDGMQKKYYIDVGKRKMPEDAIKNLSINEFVKKYSSRESDYMHIDSPVFETDKILYTELRYKAQNYPLFYSKESGTLICSKYYSNSMNYALGLPTRITHIYGDTFAGYIEAHQIVRSMDSWRENPDLLAEIPDNIRKFSDEINEDDNPVLVFFTLKNF
ncbi:MAG: 6-bladed beta-propeller [Marinilabiliales bacterium]|nr:MAG: 6-bladed beta-propeller [Marinilabiliales bacterium]